MSPTPKPPYRDKASELIGRVRALARRFGKKSGFTIGSTGKIDPSGLYFTPVRVTDRMVSAGVTVYGEDQAAVVAALADGRVDYVLVDAEKKIPFRNRRRQPADIERAVRRVIRKSRLWVYKGNDLSVDAVDGLLAQLTIRSRHGLAGRRVAILGAGNVGFKLALRLAERGARVVITRRNRKILRDLVRVIDQVKPAFTTASVTGTTDNAAAARRADILIGTSDGQPIITAAMIDRLAPGAVIVDVGKGVLHPEAIARAWAKGRRVYRLDITAAFAGLVHRLWAAEELVERKLGRRRWRGEFIVSGGLLGARDDFIVDDVHRPAVIYGIADGCGDFVRRLSPDQGRRLARLEGLLRPPERGRRP